MQDREQMKTKSSGYAREHAHDGVEDNLGLVEVGSSDVDEDIACIQSNLAVIAVDDGRH